MQYRFFDNASTTPCSESAAQKVLHFAQEEFGNPSSNHVFGQKAAAAIREARAFFATTFAVSPEQVIFTGGGTEADNLAVYGVSLQAFQKRKKLRVLASSVEHPAVRATTISLRDLGFEAELIPVTANAEIDLAALEKLLTPETALVSVQQVNNIVGARFPVEELARFCKNKVPGLIFHTDAVQAFGKVPHPTSVSPIDLVSISGHKIHGPKGVGALIVLNKEVLKSGLRPLIWGGEQESGFRSGTQNAGLIAGFHVAAKEILEKSAENQRRARELSEHFRAGLKAHGLIDQGEAPLRWNSPAHAVPHIVNLSFPGYPSAVLAKLLEERGCIVSTGSACSSSKNAPDAVLKAMDCAPELCTSAIRVSFAPEQTKADVDALVASLEESVAMMKKLLGNL